MGNWKKENGVMREGIAIAGNLIVDFVKEIDVYPSEGMLANITGVQTSVGGCAANTAIDLAKIDSSLPVKVLGLVGNDGNGQYVRDTLSRYDIDTKGVKTCKEVTSFTDVMTVKEGKARTFFHARGANAVFDIDDIDFDSLHSRFFHIGYALLLDRFDAPDPEYGTVMAKTLAFAQSKGFKTSMDVVSEDSDRFTAIVTPSLKYCDSLIINEVEASMIACMPVRWNGEPNTGALRAICEKLIDAGVRERVVIHAPEVACAMERGGEFVCVSSLRLPEGYIKGTVGAGDAFCAGMLYALYRGFSIREALRLGAGAAASSLSELGATEGMKDIAGIYQLINNYYVS
jgi:sugar/nucleoside kinase (ribokinase family)